MKKIRFQLLAAAAALVIASAASAQQVDRGDRTILEAATSLKSGQFVWAPELSAAGPALLVVNLETQRAVFFRNGVPIGATTVSSGKDGYETPTGVFTILQKNKEHYSKTYNNAPMPNMQRLTWRGIALHAGNLPGYPASHGCIRLPIKFSSLLFGATELGMATGFHGFHVIVGTIFLTVCLIRAWKGDFTPKQHFGFEAAAWYWHFVDVVWLFLFVSIYVWGGWGAPTH